MVENQRIISGSFENKVLSMNQLAYWPYDEVELSLGKEENEIVISSPWLNTKVAIEPSQYERAKNLALNFSKEDVSQENMVEINWFFTSLSSLPLCYILPRPLWDKNLDQFTVNNHLALKNEPCSYLLNLIKKPADDNYVDGFIKVHQDNLKEWKWDFENAIAFAKTTEGTDPFSIFSIARRFHLLSCAETNTTNKLYDHVMGLEKDTDEYKNACALMTRQTVSYTHLTLPTKA